MKPHRLRQVFLFLVVLILPAVAIVVQGRRIADQERELARTRADEQRQETERRLAAQLGRDFFARLERIKLEEMASSPAGVPQPDRYADPEAVVLIGRLDGEQVMWPWDVSASPRNAAVPGPELAAKLREAEDAEYRARDHARAADLYREAIEIARTDGARATAQLGLARSLRQIGSETAMVSVYEDLLALPWTVTDEASIPLAYYAALAPETAPANVLRRVRRDVESSNAVPSAHVRWLNATLDSLRTAGSPAVRSEVDALRARLSARVEAVETVRRLDEAHTLAREFVALRVTDTVWRPFPGPGEESWLVGMAPSAGASSPLILVVRSDAIVRHVESGLEIDGARVPFEINDSGEDGYLLGDGLPGLRVRFPSGVGVTVVSESGLEQSFYGLALLIVPLTFLSGYLLWRDMRREGRLAELRSQFVSGVSHELKTPLTSIRMFAEALQMRGTPDPRTQSEYLDTIVNESERLTRLLNNVLDFSRIERGQKTYSRTRTSLTDVVHAAVRTMRHPLEAQGFELALDVDDVPSIALDRDAIHQAILNLLTNAMKYSGERRDIALRVAANNGHAVIAVSDHGIGIARKDQARIFENFYRADVPENRAIAGTGLGLALVAHIARAHGGRVDVESSPGHGSTFSLRLPIEGAAA